MDRWQREVVDRAARTHGVLRLADLGPDRRRVEGLTRSGVLCEVGPRLYRVRGAPTTWEQAVLVAVWSRGEDAVASHRSAARIHRVPGFRSAGVEVTQLRRGGRPKVAGRGVHTTERLPVGHRTERSSIPVTTPARMVFDLARWLHPERTAVVLDQVLARKLATLNQVQQVFFHLAGRGCGGTVVMRELLEARSGGVPVPASDLEATARRLFRAHHLPEAEFEVDLGGEGWVGRVDCLFRSAKLVVEIDGWPYHDGLTQRTADRWRDIGLVAAGWRVLRFTGDDFDRRSLHVVGAIRRAIRDAA